jgi:hypothetical protein
VKKNLRTIVISRHALIEYLASGFLGVFASADPLPDRFNQEYPSIPDISLPSSDEDIVLELEMSSKDSKLHGLNISAIKSVGFHSQEKLDNFRDTYIDFPDLPIKYLNLVVIDNFEIGLPVEPHSSEEKREISPDPSRVASILIGLIHLLRTFPTACDETVSSSDSKDFETGLAMACLQFFCRKVGHQIDPSQSVLGLIESYCQAVTDGIIGQKSAGPEIISKLLSGMPDSEDPTRRFLQKIDDVLMGFGEVPALQDQPDRILQNAFYLGITYESLLSLENDIEARNIGNYTAAIASFFICCRMRLANHVETDWRNTKEEMAGLLNAVSVVLEQKKLSVEAGLKWIEEFRGSLDLKINKVLVDQVSIRPTHDQQIIISHLEKFGYQPKRAESTTKVIRVEEKDHFSVLEIKFEVAEGTTVFSEKGALKISVQSELPLPLIHSNEERILRLFEISERHGVALGISKIGTVAPVRYQLIETMDEAEIRDHMQGVARAARQLNMLVIEWS